MMSEVDIRDALEQATQMRGDISLLRLLRSIMNGENTENAEAVLVYARHVRDETPRLKASWIGRRDEDGTNRYGL